MGEGKRWVMRKTVLKMGQIGPWRLLWLASFAVVLAGCSADVVRLDSSPSFSLNDPAGSRTLLRPSASINRSAVGASNIDPGASAAYTPPRPVEQIEIAALPPPPSNPAAAYSPPASYAPPAASARPAPYVPTREPASSRAVAPAPIATTEKGEAIEIKPGDTLYGIAKQNKVSLSSLMQVNGLSSPALKPGQTLYLPKTVRRPITRPDATAAATTATSPSRAPSVASAQISSETAAKYNGIYTVQKGDSLYALALKLKVPMAELQQVNGITDVRKVKPGAVLKVPGSAVAAAPSPSPIAPVTAASAKVPAAVVDSQAAVADAAGGPTVPPARPVLLNGEKQVAAIDPASVAGATANDAGTGTAAPSGTAPAIAASAGKTAAAGGAAASAGVDTKLRWPVRGKIIAGFGARPDGTHNDGVNVQVPQGTEVHAAEAGAVAYAGSELKGYGNLVLVRHDNGWITAYAHNSEIMVKRGDRVKRGQVISKAGKSGSVDQPQVHFELRQGSKPVDPTPYLERM